MRNWLPSRSLESGTALEQISFWVFVATIAWAPFPLGSNRPWSWSLLTLLIAAAWLLWYFSIWNNPTAALRRLSGGLAGPIILGLAAIGWGVVQILPVVPMPWAHPVWRAAAELTGARIVPTISLSPWDSATELMKLLSYLMAAWLARTFARDPKRASHLLNALIATGAAYAAYGFILTATGYSQFELFFGMPLQQTARDFPGPFVNHNSFATYEGLVALCAGGRLISETWNRKNRSKEILTRVIETGRFLLGKGIIWLVAAALALSAVISTGSRAGNLATWSAVAALLFIGGAVATRQKRGWAVLAITLLLAVSIVPLLAMSGTSLAGRMTDMANTGSTDTTRMLLWNDALQMIHHAPLAGWGLGTYQSVYPLFSTTTMPFIIDKAHNDYLELAAGWGLPASILWWSALLWLAAICLRGLSARRQMRVYPALGVGATILVGIHSIFDFSLQMPAIALTYAAILGIGVAQAFPTKGAVEE